MSAAAVDPTKGTSTVIDIRQRNQAVLVNDGRVRRSGFAGALPFRLSHCRHFKHGRVSRCTVVCRDLARAGRRCRSDSAEGGGVSGKVASFVLLRNEWAVKMRSGTKPKNQDFGKNVNTSVVVPFEQNYTGCPFFT